MFAQDGVVNLRMQAMHLIGSPIPWMTDPFWAKVLIILAKLWRWTGYNMIFLFVAMQNIDRSIYEVARHPTASRRVAVSSTSPSRC